MARHIYGSWARNGYTDATIRLMNQLYNMARVMQWGNLKDSVIARRAGDDLFQAIVEGRVKISARRPPDS
ncbi:MAG TPA: hypothetical protein DCL72_00165 [Rhizobiales bacterium]|nr:hypothetical protein [Hyphomicrobiales bacterium]